MRYVSLTAGEMREMLEVIGAERIEDLFSTIPENLRLKRPLDLPEAQSESTLIRYFTELGQKNASADRLAYFLGAGAYHHFIPTLLDTLISRAEFYTTYTPYQAEISQGTLQAIFEYQTLICQLTGMEVANASLYDGSSALAEGVLMACRLTHRSRILVPASLHPHYRAVLATYLSSLSLEVETVPFGESGQMDLAALKDRLTEEHAAVVVQSPNFFGVIEEIEEVARSVRAKGALSVVAVTEAISLGLLKPPGEMGADVVVGEGQSFGIPLSSGGPYVGFFATRDEFKRQMPGRLVGQTVDAKGRRGFVLTLATREQHIRREKATSNICTNQGLCALMAAIFLSTLGRKGLRQLAEQNLKKAHYLRRQLQDALVFNGPVFNEFVISCGDDPRELNRRLLSENIVGGLPLDGLFPDRKEQMLVCVTEQNSRQSMDRFVEVFKSARVTL